MKYKFKRTYSDYMLDETLKTHDIDFTITKIEHELSMLNYNFDLTKNDNVLELKLNSLYSMDLIDIKFEHINSLFIDRFGWFPSKMTIMNRVNNKNVYPYNQDYIFDNSRYIDYVIIYFESKYDLIHEQKDKMYHLSVQQYSDNILTKGLIPKSKSKLSKHLDRVYLCDDVSACYKLISQMKMEYLIKKSKNVKNKINDKWIIYNVDMKNLNIDVYDDPNYIYGYYIIDNIPPNRIGIYDSE